MQRRQNTLRLRSLSFRRVSLPASVAALLALSACRDATQARITLTTDALCADVVETSITTGLPSAFESAAPVAVTSACDAGRIGDLVLVPSGGKEEPFAVRVVTGLNKSADDCIRDGYVGGCIVARRTLRFLPHRSIELPIELEVACKDVPCNATQTCRHGQCVSAEVDPTQCLGSSPCDVSPAHPSGGAGGGGGASGSADAGGTDSGGAPNPSGGNGGNGGTGAGGGSGENAGESGATSDAGASGSTGGETGSTCGNGLIEGKEACDDANFLPGDGCVACQISPNWGCRNAPSECTPVQHVTFTDGAQDDLPSDALDALFSNPVPDALSFLYVGIDAPAPHGFEYCLERADWYAGYYLSSADSSLTVPSGAWNKWWRQPGSDWSAPVTSPHQNYFGTACEPGGRAFCAEWMLGNQLIGLQPAYKDASELFSNGYGDANSHWIGSVRVGPTRLSACGF